MANIKITKAQSGPLIKIGLYLILLIGAIAILIYLSDMEESYEKKKTWLKNDIGAMGRKLEGLNKKTLEFSDAVKTWEGMSDDDKKLQGLRINDVKDLLEKLQNKYKFSSVKITFSKPDEMVGDYKTDSMGMVSSIISMNFNALSDDYVYNFLGEISKEFPGYVQIKSLSINKPLAITKEIIKKISVGEEVPVIPVALDFYWFDLKYKGGTAAQTPAAAEDKK